MAQPSHQGTGDREDNWMQLENGFWNPEDGVNFNDLIMQPEDGLWDPEPNVGFDENLANMFLSQHPIAGDEVGRTLYNHINNFVANGNGSEGYTGASIPRGGAPLEQVRALFTPSFQVIEDNMEPQHLLSNVTSAEKVQDEPEYVTHARTQHATKRARKSAGPSSEEWQKRKQEIHSLYVDAGYDLKATRKQMADNGFQAEESMYKRRIKEWGWGTYRGRGNSGGEPSLTNSGKRTRGKAPGPRSTLREENSQPNNSRSTTMGASTPPPLADTHSLSSYSNCTHSNNITSQSNISSGTTVAVYGPSRLVSTHVNATHFNATHFNMGIPARMSQTDFDETLTNILAKVDSLYISYPAQKKWKVESQREIEEDEHDDLLVGIASSLRDCSSSGPVVGYTGFQEALGELEKVVGVGEGADCGLFSLPAIWVSFLRIIRHQRPDWASEFLSLALRLAKGKYGLGHPFVQVLLNLQKIWVMEPAQLEEVVFAAYLKCIAVVEDELGSFNYTYLSLWGDYVVYLDGRSVNETQAMVKGIRSVIKILEEETGPGCGPDGDYTLKLLGLILYVLQSSPAMADEAEKVAKELLLRVERRKATSEGRLEGDLFVTWKDVRQVLGKFCLDRMDYHQAIGYLEDFLSYEIEDQRDKLALEKLEKCYLALRRDTDVENTRQRLIDSSQRLLHKTEAEPVEGEKVVNDHGTRGDEDSENVSEKDGGSESTVANQVEQGNEESVEEDDIDEFGDSEAEIQLVKDQIAELQQRLTVLEQARRRGL